MLDTTTVRAALLEELATLNTRADRISAHLRNADRSLSADAPDRATEMGNDAVLEALDDTSRARTEEIRAALARLDEGTYGICARCGDEIDARRLEALPTTALCIECASA